MYASVLNWTHIILLVVIKLTATALP